MGTSYNVKYIPHDKAISFDELSKEINDILVEINQQMSTYIPTSEISIFNKDIKKDTPYKISGDFYKTLKLSLEIASMTSGKFDPTIGPLVNLWGFGPSSKRKIPNKDELKAAQERVGYEKIILTSNSISKTIDDLYLDLSASAKGYAVDKLSEYLESEGIFNYMVEIGGEVRTKGNKHDTPWKIAIESPHPSDRSKPFQKVLNLTNQAVATSGNYRNFFKEGGRSYGHTIDFRTGRPAENTLASVTVVDPKSCAKADALATALMVMGVNEGFVFAEKNGIMAYFVYSPSGEKEELFTEKATSHFKGAFKE